MLRCIPFLLLLPMLLLIAGIGDIHGQELIVNGGLEQAKRCPDGPTNKRLKVDGRVKSAQGDPDRYAACSGSFGVPSNWSGHQEAWEGDAYAGLLLTSDMPDECGAREYLQFPLQRSLEAGRRYRLTFRVSPADHSGYATDRVGAIFSAADHSRKGVPPGLRERAHVENPLGRMIDDTTGWTTVTGIHNALGGERFVVIGNFHTCNSSTRIRMHGGKRASLELKNAARLDPIARRGAWRTWMARTAYVYLDGVSLMVDSTGPERIAVITADQACPPEVPSGTGPELVPDPGFDHNLHPTPNSWRSASAATPDLLNGKVGLYLYSAGFTDNREYIRIPLETTLSPCTTYRVSMDVRRDPSYGYAVDAIGVAVTDTFSNRYDRLRIDLPWAWRSPPGALLSHSDRWTTLCGTFTPELCAQHLLVGNFDADSATTVLHVGAAGDGPFAYTFLDNLHLVVVSTEPGCVDPCAATVLLAPDSVAEPFVWPEHIVLHFATDNVLPLEVDSIALMQLAERLNDDQELGLHITGHADASGTAASNEQLALARAQRLRVLLLQYGAPESSISIYSEGSRVPIADNSTPEGRAANRRVEVELQR